jgi:hypothetical protein
MLSGGLGSSAYVRDQLIKGLLTLPHPSATRFIMIQDPEPQLVVTKGLLLDRLQKLDSGETGVLAARRARASYGIVCRFKYNPDVHQNEHLITDPMDGQVYATGQIDWVIRKVCLNCIHASSNITDSNH